jgi:hypothetical protein
MTMEPWEIDPRALEIAEDHLRVELVKMGLEYIRRNRVETDPTPERRAMRKRVLRLRDATIYRAWSLLWHASTLYARRQATWRHFEENIVASIETSASGDPGPFQRHMQQQFFLLDDVVFNAVSLYDYLGNLIGVTRFNGRTLLWTDVVEMCGKTPCPLTGEGLPQLITEANSHWIAQVGRFRGTLIHNEDLPKLGEQSFSSKTNVLRWRIWMPEAWKDTITKLGLTGPERIEMEDAGFVIAQAALRTATGIVRMLYETFPMAPWTWEKKRRGAGVPP